MKRRLFAIIFAFVLTTAVAFGQTAQSKRAPEKVKDPVCGLMVEKDPNLSSSYKGETYYFCSKADMEKFKKEPEKYARKK
jgi:Cu+-exporting ATPase